MAVIFTQGVSSPIGKQHTMCSWPQHLPLSSRGFLLLILVQQERQEAARELTSISCCWQILFQFLFSPKKTENKQIPWGTAFFWYFPLQYLLHLILLSDNIPWENLKMKAGFIISEEQERKKKAVLIFHFFLFPFYTRLFIELLCFQFIIN